MKWRAFTEHKPRFGDIVAIRTAPEQADSYRVTTFCENTEWVVGSQWVWLDETKHNPLEGGVLHLEEHEKKELSEILFLTTIHRLVYIGGEIIVYVSPFHNAFEISNVKAINYILERFNLEEV